MQDISAVNRLILQKNAFACFQIARLLLFQNILGIDIATPAQSAKFVGAFTNASIRAITHLDGDERTNGGGLAVLGMCEARHVRCGVLSVVYPDFRRGAVF